MEVLTRKNNLIRIDTSTQEVSLVRSNISFFKKTEEYTALGTPNYLEISAGKKVLLSLFRKVKDVHVVLRKEKTETLGIYLIGEKWVEYLENTEIQNELELKYNINYSCIYEKTLFLLSNEKLSLYNKHLKKLHEIPLKIKYADSISILSYQEKSLVGLLSGTERKAVIIHGKDTVKEIRVSKHSKEIKIVEYMEEVYAIIAEGTKIKVVGIFNEIEKVVETDHINAISQIEYVNGIVYSVSCEGIICSFALKENEAIGIYVDAEGIERIGVVIPKEK